MSHFYPAAPADMRYPRDVLDGYAARGGVVTAIGYGYGCNNETPQPQHGYSFRWVGKCGMGNHGWLVLVGETPRTRELLHRGRVTATARDLGVDEATAVALTRAAAGIQYGHERLVLRAALALAHLPPGSLDSAPRVGGGLSRWCDPGMLGREAWEATRLLSCPRLASAIEIARRCVC